LHPGAAGVPGSDAITSAKVSGAGNSAGSWQLVPRPRIFGSDELSALSPGLAELVVPAFIELCPGDADSLGVASGDGVEVGDGLATLEVRVNAAMAPGCAGYSIGFDGTANLAPLARVELRRASHWQRAPQLIGSDRSTGPGDSHV
jgi:NADH-quinone oxidoreductase subunit G